MTRQVIAGGVKIGGGAPVTVQTMTNTDTRDLEATSAQIKRLAQAGADIVRVSVFDEACADNVRALVDASPVPLVADIHFDYRLAVRSIENGISKLRINPGNIGGEARVRILADCLKAHHIPVRVGVNAGSLEKDILAKYGGVTPEAMVESALGHAKMLEKCGFYDVVISMKAPDVKRTIESYRLAARTCEYPLHVGVTHAGSVGMGQIKSAIGIGALLADGIGDTIRVSLTGDPQPEVAAGIDILRAVGLRGGVDVIACPTCGRTCIDVEGIARRVEEATRSIKADLKVAVMGCVVNGPGESKEADIGIAGGQNGGALFVKGEDPRPVRGDLFEALMKEIYKKMGNGEWGMGN